MTEEEARKLGYSVFKEFDEYQMRPLYSKLYYPLGFETLSEALDNLERYIIEDEEDEMIQDAEDKDWFSTRWLNKFRLKKTPEQEYWKEWKKNKKA